MPGSAPAASAVTTASGSSPRAGSGPPSAAATAATSARAARRARVRSDMAGSYGHPRAVGAARLRVDRAHAGGERDTLDRHRQGRGAPVALELQAPGGVDHAGQRGAHLAPQALLDLDDVPEVLLLVLD